MLDFNRDATTADKLSRVPVLQQVIGLSTVISNGVKCLHDLFKRSINLRTIHQFHKNVPFSEEYYLSKDTIIQNKIYAKFETDKAATDQWLAFVDKGPKAQIKGLRAGETLSKKEIKYLIAYERTMKYAENLETHLEFLLVGVIRFIPGLGSAYSIAICNRSSERERKQAEIKALYKF